MENYTGITYKGVASTPYEVSLYFLGQLVETVNTNDPCGKICRRKYQNASKVLRSKLKLLKLEQKLSILDSKLYEEKLRVHAMLSSRGWGYGMRCTKIGYSEIKENRIIQRIKSVKEQIATEKREIEQLMLELV